MGEKAGKVHSPSDLSIALVLGTLGRGEWGKRRSLRKKKGESVPSERLRGLRGAKPRNATIDPLRGTHRHTERIVTKRIVKRVLIFWHGESQMLVVENQRDTHNLPIQPAGGRKGTGFKKRNFEGRKMNRSYAGK